MTKEEAIKYLQQLYPNGGHCWLDEQRIEAIGMAIQAFQEEPVSEELDREIDYYLRELQSFKSEHGIDCYTVSIEDMDEICRHFAEWQKHKDSLPISDNLEKFAREIAKYERSDDTEVSYDINKYEGVIAGAQWQKEQDKETIELAEDHAMFAGMEKMKEQMMAKAVEAKVTARWPLHSSPLYYSYEIYVPYAQHLSEGDNVKILIIKKEDD